MHMDVVGPRMHKHSMRVDCTVDMLCSYCTILYVDVRT
jgi:hypothetical protein